MARWKGVLFDLDGTLYPYEPCHQSGLQAAWAKWRSILGGSEERFLKLYEKARQALHERLSGRAASHSRLLYFHAALEEAAGESLPSQALELEEAYWSAYLQTMKRLAEPQGRELLLRLRKAGTLLGLVSDLTSGIQFRKLQTLGLDRAFDAVVTSEEAGMDKPSPFGLELSLRKLGLLPSQAVLVGDDARKDGGAAAALGLEFIPFGGKDRDFSGLAHRLGVALGD